MTDAIRARDPVDAAGQSSTDASDTLPAEDDGDLFRVPTSTDPNQLWLPLRRKGVREWQESDRISTYEWPILSFIGESLVATVHQVVYRFATYDAKNPAPFGKLLRDFERRGLLRKIPLYPERGAVSPEIVVLTADGWRHVGLTPQRAPLHEPPHRLAYRLQVTDMRLEMEARGWARITDPKYAWGVLRAWGVRAARRPGMRREHAIYRDRIQRMPQPALPCEVWFQFRTGAVQLTLPSVRGDNLDARLAAMPNLRLWPTLPIHLVGADPTRTARDRVIVERWAARTRHPVRVIVPRAFYLRVHPWKVPKLTHSLYESYATLSPRELVKLELAAGQAARDATACYSDRPRMPRDVLRGPGARLRGVERPT